MITINQEEKNTILELHSKFKQILIEQNQKQTPDLIIAQTTANAIGQRLFRGKMCFCSVNVANCQAPITDQNNKTTIRAQVLTNSNQTRPNGQPVYNSGDFITYNLDDFTFVVDGSTTKHNWKCSAISEIIIPMRQNLLVSLKSLGWKTLQEMAPYGYAVEDPKKYDKKQLNVEYPFLFPKWENVDMEIYTLYKPKSTDISAESDSEPSDNAERIRIEEYIKQDPSLVTKRGAMDQNNVEDFQRIEHLYDKVQIGKVGDGVFERPFYLYRRKGGQKGARELAKDVKQSIGELNINKPTCAKLIKQLHSLSKLKDTGTLTPEQFNQLKNKVTYCSRKYDNYGILGSDKVDDMLMQLKGLSSTNQFKIK